MSRKGTRQLRVSMERIKAAANSRLMRLAQRMSVGGALLLDRVARRLELLVAQERSTQWLSYCQACRLFRRITATLVSVGSRRKSTESATSSPGSGSRRASALGLTSTPRIPVGCTWIFPAPFIRRTSEVGSSEI